MRVRVSLVTITALLLALAADAGTFQMRDVYYAYQDGGDYVRVMVGARAEYVGSQVDANDNSWAIETSLSHLGTTYKNFANSGAGIPNVGFTIECKATSCGAFHDIPKCNPQGNGSQYLGSGQVAIYHQFSPEIDTGSAGWGSTTCNQTTGDPLDPQGGDGTAPGDGTCNAGCPGTSTPLLIDLDRGGFRLTSFEGGTLFDLDRDGVAERLSWTARGSGDGWLVLDRNANGVIDDGGELFGNFTDQPASAEPNGYTALAVFDANADGWISLADPVFAELAVWVDHDQDGRSSAEELQTLASAGVVEIELTAVESRRQDQHGNQFRYTSMVRLERGTTRMVDVYLLSSEP